MYPKDLIDLSEKLFVTTDTEVSKVVQESSHEEVKRILEEGPCDLAERFRSRFNEVMSDVNSFGKARINLMTNRVGSAKVDFEKSISEGFQVGDSYNSLGLIAGAHGDFNKAMEYQKLSAENGFYPARINLANTYFMLGEYDLAKAQLEKVFSLGEEGLVVLFSCAEQMEKSRNLDLSIFIFEFLAKKDVLDAMISLCNMYYRLRDRKNFQKYKRELYECGFDVLISTQGNEIN